MTNKRNWSEVDAYFAMINAAGGVNGRKITLLTLDDAALDHCLAAHLSAERAHRHALKLLGKVPLLDLGMRLGEGSGGALAVGVVKAAVACHNGMATFAEAGVAGKGEP